MAKAVTTTLMAPPTPTPELTGNLSKLERWAENLVVNDAASYQQSFEDLQKIKQMEANVIAFFAPSKQAADKAHKEIVRNEKLFLDRLRAVVARANAVRIDWRFKENTKAEAERARKQAEKDEATRKERERLEKEAARLKSPEKKQERLEQAQSLVAPVVPKQSAVPEIKGDVQRKTWVHEIVDMDALFAFVCECKRKDLFLPNEKVIDAYAKAMRSRAEMPGVFFREQSTMAIGKG